MQNRKDFIRKVAGGAVFSALGSYGLFSYAIPARQHTVESDNPYTGIDWHSIRKVNSTSHLHITTEEQLRSYYGRCNLRHMPISNYYPSVPYYPIADIKANQFKVRQEFGVM